MKQNRRNFLKTSLTGAALLTLGGAPFTACSSKKEGNKTAKAELKLSFQESTPPGETLNEKFDYMEQLGIVGFEPWGGGLPGRVEEIKKAYRKKQRQEHR